MRTRRTFFGLLILAVLAGGAAFGAFYLLSSNYSQNSQNPSVAANQESTQQAQSQATSIPEDTTLKLTVPKLSRVDNASIPDAQGDDEEMLKNYAAIHLQGTGFPWEEEANVYIAGHRLGYPGYPSFLAFYDLDNLEKGDDIFIEDANGKKYTYKVSDIIEAEPTDIDLIEPVPGKNIVTLQTCTLPDYAKRLLVRGELVDNA
ncbi:MAG: sortase [Rubrobacter sp.]|nr:sortase [Rubrobacter sp.]